MASRLNPYLMFGGDAKEALTFYRDVFGGDLALSTFGDMDPGAANADKIMHGQLETPAGYTLMGGDGNEAGGASDNASVSISGDDGDELRGYWQRLSADARVDVPLEKQAWGDEFGMCTDRFGVRWMVNIGAPRT